MRSPLKTKVFVVIERAHHDTDSIVGVFATREDAEDAVQKVMARSEPPEPGMVAVCEYTIGEIDRLAL